MVDAAAQLLQERGYFGTGIRDVLERSGAPRGSMYFHFPDGKEQLAVEAVRQSGDDVRTLLQSVLSETDDLGEAMERVTAVFVDQLVASDFTLGCPVAPAVLHPGDCTGLAGAVDQTFGSWHETIATKMRSAGVPADRAESAAWLALSALEGALLLSRARRDVTPLQRTGHEVATQLRSLVPAGTGPATRRATPAHPAATTPPTTTSRARRRTS